MSDSRNGMVPTSVFDLDGVLADAQHRLHLLDRTAGTSAGLRQFHAASVYDRLIVAGLGILRAKRAIGHRIVIVSARPEWLRPETEEWLRAQSVWYDRLMLEPPEFDQPRYYAEDYKEAAWRWLEQHGHEIKYILDDTVFVCQRAARLGYPSFEFRRRGGRYVAEPYTGYLPPTPMKGVYAFPTPGYVQALSVLRR